MLQIGINGQYIHGCPKTGLKRNEPLPRPRAFAKTADPRRHLPRPRLGTPLPRRRRARREGCAAVTVLKAVKSCFASIVEASGIIIPRQETAVRPERPGLKVAEILAEPGDTAISTALPAKNAAAVGETAA